MDQALGLVLPVIGIVLIDFGFNPSDEFSSDASRSFAGTLTSKGIWLVIGAALPWSPVSR
jgi:Protein of unknown function (DUF3185)